MPFASSFRWALLLTSTAILAAAPVRPARAEDVPAAPSSSVARERALSEIRSVLERPESAARLRDAGLTAEAVMERASTMTDAEIRYLAERMRAEEQSGGDALGAILILAVIALIVVLIIVLLDDGVDHAPGRVRASPDSFEPGAILG